MKRYILTCLCLLIGLSGIAQETGALTVEVVDEDDGSPIIFATVLLVQEGKVMYGLQTDEKGYVQLKELIPDDYGLIVWYLGETLGQVAVHIDADNPLILKVEGIPREMEIDSCEFSNYVAFPNFWNGWSGQTLSADEIRRSPFR